MWLADAEGVVNLVGVGVSVGVVVWDPDALSKCDAVAVALEDAEGLGC